MTQDRVAERAARQLARIETALARYMADVNDVSAGHAIIGFARAGLLAPRKAGGDEADILDAGKGELAPTAGFYPILRRARLGTFTAKATSA